MPLPLRSLPELNLDEISLHTEIMGFSLDVDTAVAGAVEQRLD